MKDKNIKEILEALKVDEEELELKSFVYPLQLTPKQQKILLNYITNLQEENEKLKEENKHIFANVNDDQLLRSNAMNYAEAQDYKTRNEKAVDYINKSIDNYTDWYNYIHGDEDGKVNNLDVLLNILQGKSDE